MKGIAPILVFAMVWPTMATFVYFVGLASPAEQATGPNLWLQSFYSGSKVVQFLLPVVWLGLLQRQSLRLRRPNLNGLGLGVGFGVLVGAAGFALYFGWLRHSAMLAQTPAQLRAKLADFGAATPIGFLLLATFLSVVHSLLEEYYWRWFVFGELRQLIPVGAAMIVSGLAFMSHHVVVLAIYFPGHFLTATLPLSLGVAIGGIFWAWLYQRSGSLVAPWISHLLIDAAIMAIGYELLFVRSAG